MDFRVHHKSAAGLLIQLRRGGFGRITVASCGGDVLSQRLMAHVNPQRDDVIVCGPTGETDADGYQVFSTDLRRIAAPLRLTPHVDAANLLVDLAKRNAICGLGRRCRARVISQRDEGSILKLSNGLNAVALGKIVVDAAPPADAPIADEDGDDDGASTVAAPSYVNVRVLSYDERGSGMVTCSAAPAVVASAHHGYAELMTETPTAGLASGTHVSLECLVTVSSANVAGSAEPVALLVGRVSYANEAKAAMGHGGAVAHARPSTDLLVYCQLPKGHAAPKIGDFVAAILTYVPAAHMLTATPFCMGVLASAVSPVTTVGVPASRLVTSSALIRPDVCLFPWRDPAVNAAEDRAEDDEAEHGEASKGQRRRRLEEEIDRFERKGEQVPTTPDDFEKKLLATPYSSYLWTQYMSHHVALRRIDAARNVAERALQRIPVTEPASQLNVWVAYMNLENTHGTAESLTAIFRRAVERTDDTQQVYERLADIFAATGKKQQRVELCKAMTSKFRRERRVWEKFCDALIDTGKRDQLKRVFRDMAGALSNADQTLVSVHAAVHEYKQGSPEHGRALFESLVARSPKRSDIWSTYLDQERALLARNAPEASVTGVRHVFERASTVSMPPKVMQSMLTQWLSYETTNGAAADVQKVKDKARAYVESRAAATASAVGVL